MKEIRVTLTPLLSCFWKLQKQITCSDAVSDHLPTQLASTAAAGNLKPTSTKFSESVNYPLFTKNSTR